MIYFMKVIERREGEGRILKGFCFEGFRRSSTFYWLIWGFLIFVQRIDERRTQGNARSGSFSVDEQ